MIGFERINVNKFWDKTPTPLKYILVLTVLLATSYFMVTKKIDDNHINELDAMRVGIAATYELIDSFEEFKKEQTIYNEEVLTYLNNLHTLLQELNNTTNRKFDMLLKSGSRNTDDILEKIMLLNESFEKVSKIYQENIQQAPTQENNVKKNYEIMVVPMDNKNKK